MDRLSCGHEKAEVMMIPLKSGALEPFNLEYKGNARR